MLCEEATRLPEGPELTELLRELRQALQEQNRRLRQRLRDSHPNRRSPDKPYPTEQHLKVALIKAALLDS